MRPDQNTIQREGVGGGVGSQEKKMLVMILLCASRVKIPHYTNLFSLVRSQDAISGLQSSPDPWNRSRSGPKITASSSSSVVSVLKCSQGGRQGHLSINIQYTGFKTGQME